MGITLDDIGPVIIALPLFGLLVMTVIPGQWQTAGNWLLVSFAGIPLFFVALALLINVPALLILVVLLLFLNVR